MAYNPNDHAARVFGRLMVQEMSAADLWVAALILRHGARQRRAMLVADLRRYLPALRSLVALGVLMWALGIM